MPRPRYDPASPGYDTSPNQRGPSVQPQAPLIFLRSKRVAAQSALKSISFALGFIADPVEREYIPPLYRERREWMVQA